ncbi:hypothetical protein FHS27_003316 [Rhodopirellula rubra]|uniref:Uncharacterized protein n=1 Tax=Aporhodopirellula rubra TaxID=980271 RepID=A0A7W5DZP1_9BACT|nr:hypothetical protein [Aporhodopirellula rubra]
MSTIDSNSTPSTVHPRVVSLIRERIGVDTCRTLSDDDLVRCASGTALMAVCQLRYVGEQVSQSLSDLVSGVSSRLGREVRS